METSRSSPVPSANEAVAIIAAIEQFLRDTALPPPLPVPPSPISAWVRAGLDEGVARQPERLI